MHPATSFLLVKQSCLTHTSRYAAENVDYIFQNKTYVPKTLWFGIILHFGDLCSQLADLTSYGINDMANSMAGLTIYVGQMQTSWNKG